MTTKIAVMADVHGNSSALLAVLKEIEKDTEIEHIYCLGDMVGIGYETNEVLSILFARNDVTMIAGNHEEEVMAILRGVNVQGHDEGERAHHEWLVDRLDSSFIPKIMALPKELTVSHGGKNLLLTHYHLDSDKQYIPIDTDPSLEKLDSIYEDSSSDLVCFGHHHPIHYFSAKTRTYLNPGSLGCSDWPFARYATVTFGDHMEVELKEAAYGNQDFLLGYEKLGVPEKDFILKVFHGNQHLG